MTRFSIMKNILFYFFFFVFNGMFLTNACADNVQNYTFWALKSSKICMRAGPGTIYPITWIYTRKNLPLQHLAQFELWIKVRDADGTIGWIRKSLLMQRHHALMQQNQTLHTHPNASSVKAYLKKGVIVAILKHQQNWTFVRVLDDPQRMTGWIKNNQNIWDGSVKKAKS